MRIPLIISGPGVPGGGSGRAKKIDTLVDTLDIRPTILDLAGVEAGLHCQGRSLAPLIRGEEMEDRPVLLESEYSLENYGWSPVAGVRTREWKFIDAPRPELYHIAEDARELNDMSRSEPDIFEKMEKMYLQLRKESESSSGAMARARSMSDEMEAKLAELGYASSREERAGQEGKDPKDMVELDEAYNQAMTLARQGRDEEGIELLKNIIARDPGNVRALVALGGALIRKAVEEDPRRIRDLVQSGGKPVESPTLDQAEYYLRRAVEAGPHVYSVHMNLAMLFKNRGNFEGARKELEAAMALKPFSPEPPNDLGVLSLMLGQPREAEKWFRKALEIDPSDVSTRINLGMLLMRTKRLKEAEAEFAAILEDEPGNVIALIQLGVVYDKTGRTQAAVELGEKAREIAPDDHVIHDCLEQWYARVGREAESREAGRRRLELQRQMLREQQKRK
jgi:Flp pilus assembly protein TadD